MSAIPSAESRLGFVGIGYMGRPIAQRLLQSGFRLSAYDRHRAKSPVREPICEGQLVAQSNPPPQPVWTVQRAEPRAPRGTTLRPVTR